MYKLFEAKYSLELKYEAYLSLSNIFLIAF